MGKLPGFESFVVDHDLNFAAEARREWILEACHGTFARHLAT
jgi:hypothetical protein